MMWTECLVTNSTHSTIPYNLAASLFSAGLLLQPLAVRRKATRKLMDLSSTKTVNRYSTLTWITAYKHSFQEEERSTLVNGTIVVWEESVWEKSSTFSAKPPTSINYQLYWNMYHYLAINLVNYTCWKLRKVTRKVLKGDGFTVFNHFLFHDWQEAVELDRRLLSFGGVDFGLRNNRNEHSQRGRKRRWLCAWSCLFESSHTRKQVWRQAISSWLETVAGRHSVTQTYPKAHVHQRHLDR